MDGEKLCRIEGQPPSRANFSERLYEEKLTTLSESTVFAHAVFV